MGWWENSHHWERKGFPGSSAGKESACNAGDLGSIPGLGRSPGEEIGYRLQYSGLENYMDCVVHGVTESQTRLSDSHLVIGLTSFCQYHRCVSSYGTSDTI